MKTEPANLTEWVNLESEATGGRLFTCGRPGRAKYGTKRVDVDQGTIDLWVSGLPEGQLHLVSLLGRKPDGFSEFGYYPFRSSTEKGGLPTMQEWFDERYEGKFRIHEIPTRDMQGIPAATLEMAGKLILKLIRAGEVIVVMDSAGAERTARVCESIGYLPLN